MARAIINIPKAPRIARLDAAIHARVAAAAKPKQALEEPIVNSNPPEFAMPRVNLAPGHTITGKDTFWAIVLRDENGKLYSTRITWNKVDTPFKAALSCYQRPPNQYMTFYNLGESYVTRDVLRLVPKE